MDIEEARLVADRFGIQIAFDKNLKLWALVINDMLCYVTADELEKFSLSDFAQELKLVLSFYASFINHESNQGIVYH